MTSVRADETLERIADVRRKVDFKLFFVKREKFKQYAFRIYLVYRKSHSHLVSL